MLEISGLVVVPVAYQSTASISQADIVRGSSLKRSVGYEWMEPAPRMHDK